MKLLPSLCLLLAFAASGADARPPQNEEERAAALRVLKWVDGQQVTLPVSHGSLKAPDTEKQLVGPDAVSLWEILNGVDAPPGTEATLYNPGTKELVFFQKIDDGYVRLDDWGDVDADAMLKAVSENTETSNERRRAAGIPAVHVVGWLERPHLDRATNTVQWAFEAKDDESNLLVNRITLMLGRDGFEKLTWAGDKTTGGDLLRVARASFNFPVGGLYTDFQSGDKVAEYGIAGLVAAVLGVKTMAKLGLFAVLLAFGKKFLVLLLVPLLGGLAWLRRLFTGKQPPAA